MTARFQKPEFAGDADGISVERVSISELFNLREEWDAILRQCCPDRIFLSYSWISSWWDAFGAKQADFEPCILIARDEGGTLIGIAPLYFSSDRVKSLLKTRRLQFLGTSFRKRGVTRTEYVDFPLQPERRAQILDAFFEQIDKFNFDEFVVTDLIIGSETHSYLVQRANDRRYLARHVGHSEGNRISLDGSFEKYLSEIGKNTRLRIFNRRKIFESLGKFEMRSFDASELTRAFSLLSDLFESRWGQPIFSGDQSEFQTTLVSRLPADAALEMSALYLDGDCVSILYNIRYGSTEYNFLSGFREDLHPKLSVGMLHFGYALEKSFADGMRHFDFLLGQGRNSNYKRNFRGARVEAECLQIVTNRKLRYLYGAFDRVAHGNNRSEALEER